MNLNLRHINNSTVTPVDSSSFYEDTMLYVPVIEFTQVPHYQAETDETTPAQP